MRLRLTVLSLGMALCGGAQAQQPWQPSQPSPQQSQPSPQQWQPSPQQSQPSPQQWPSPQQSQPSPQQSQPSAQQAPPCVQEFFRLRDDAEKKAAAIKAANERKAPPKEACQLFGALMTAQSKMLKFANENGTWCGIPPQIAEQIKVAEAKISEIRTKVCQAAAAPPRPQGPSLSDALSSPIPDSNNTKTGRGTFDTLTGNPLGNR